MRKLKLFIILLTVSVSLSLLAVASPVKALTTTDAQKYALEKLKVNSTEVDKVPDLKARLEFEINRMIDRGHLKPAYFEVGIIGSFILWGYPGEEPYILSLALPYLTVATQTRLKTFLAQEVRAYDPTSKGFEHCTDGWGSCELTGNRREFYHIPTSPDPEPITANIYPPPTVPTEAIYMMWSYAENTGDWSFISTATPPSGTRWNALKSLFSAIPATPTRYGQITGALGYLRLLEHYNLQSDPTYQQALNIITAGMNAGLDFRAFVDASYQSFINYGVGHDWGFTPFHFLRRSNAVGAQFAPEIGRYLGDNALNSVKTVVQFNPNQAQTGQQPAIESHWPTWFPTRGTFPLIRPWVGHYGENHRVTPDTSWAVFMIDAYVFNQSGTNLYKHLSSPSTVGDLYYIQNVVATIEGYGQKCWQNIKTGAVSCSGAPTATACQKADINQDSLVDLSDYTILVANFLKTSPANPRADINTDGLVDISDYSSLVSNFLKSCAP